MIFDSKSVSILKVKALHITVSVERVRSIAPNNHVEIRGEDSRIRGPFYFDRLTVALVVCSLVSLREMSQNEKSRKINQINQKRAHKE